MSPRVTGSGGNTTSSSNITITVTSTMNSSIDMMTVPAVIRGSRDEIQRANSSRDQL